MRTPPFVQVWIKNKRKRFYLFHEERIYFVNDNFHSAEDDDEHPDTITFTPSEGGVVIEVDDNNSLVVTGAKRKRIEVTRPMFFGFKNYDLFIDNVDGAASNTFGEFNITGLDLGRELNSALLYARSDSPVFLIGDTGTGKEILAKNIHYNSPRKHEPFLVFNCSSFNEDVAEMELFGSIRGAYTNAMDITKGTFMSAGRGTIVLDEIGSLPMSVQPMLLRAIEAGEVKAVGSDVVRHHKARIIITSNVSPRELLISRKIREDLFYRIEACTAYLPELRSRQDNIVRLAEFYAGDEYKISDEVKKKFAEYEWPGNMRELKNVMERAMLLVDILSKGKPKVIASQYITLKNSLDDMFSDIKDPSVILNINDIERETIRKALNRNSWNIGNTSEELDVCRSTLLAKIKEYNLVKY